MRSRSGYGIREEVGITYRYDYDVRSTGRTYEDRFFAELRRLSKAAPLTDYQELYNEQEQNAKVVRGNHTIDAPSVEKWLALHPPSGIDTRRNTVFLIDWSDRSDFEHHVYTKIGEPDPDTGFDFGKERDSRKLIAWGGTTADDEETGLGVTRRVWFHDALGRPRVVGGQLERRRRRPRRGRRARLPHPAGVGVRPGNYRAASALTGDLAKLVRFVAIDLLFTPSPLYPVDLPTPMRAGPVDRPRQQHLRGQPRHRRQPRLRRPLARARRAGRAAAAQAAQLRQPGPAVPRRLPALLRRLPRGRRPATRSRATRRSPTSSCRTRSNCAGRRTTATRSTTSCRSSTTRAERGRALPGLRRRRLDRRHAVASSSASSRPDIIAAGYGLTTTLIHEVGHHVGLSHPHDGFDAPSRLDYEPTGDFFFAWAGDEVNSMMSYIDVNWDFSQFDRDNMDRFQAAEQVEAANRLAAAAWPEHPAPVLRRAPAGRPADRRGGVRPRPARLPAGRPGRVRGLRRRDAGCGGRRRAGRPDDGRRGAGAAAGRPRGRRRPRR